MCTPPRGVRQASTPRFPWRIPSGSAIAQERGHASNADPSSVHIRGTSMDTLPALNFRVARMKGVIALGVVAVFLSSCATAGDRARTEGMFAGAGTGPAVGGGLGYLAGGNGVTSGVGAAIGAAIGGTAGYVYADWIAKRHATL